MSVKFESLLQWDHNYFCHCYEEMVFSFLYVPFPIVKSWETFHSETKANLYLKDSIVSTSGWLIMMHNITLKNIRQRLLIRALTQNDMSGLNTVWKFPSYLFFKFYILALFFTIFHVLEVNSMFGIWICGLRKLQEYKCSTSLLSRPLWREHNEKNRL